MSIDDSGGDEQRRKRGPKRRKVNHACLYCRRSHMTCDEGRPCQRCIKREIGHLCHDEPKTQSSQQQPSTTSTSNPQVTTLAEAHAAHLSKYPDQAPPLLEIMHGFPVPLQTPDSIPFGGAPNPHVQHYPPPQHPNPQMQQQQWPSFLQDPFGMQEHPNLGNELTALHTFIENFGDGQAFFNPPQPQPSSSQPQSLPSSSQPLPSPLQQTNQPTSSISPTSPSNSSHQNMSSNGHNHSPQDQAAAPTQNGSQPLSSPNGLDMMGLNGMNGYGHSPNNQNGSSLPISTPTSTQCQGHGQTPAPIIPASKQEAFLLTAADQASGSRDERLARVIRSKYEAGLLKPYNYVNGYARLSHWMDRNVSPESKRLILEPLSILRPKFRAVAQGLTDMDLVLIEEAFERLLLDYDRVFSAMAIPACLWRRTGEIYKANREFAELIGIEGRYFREGQLTIYELMDEEAAVNYWEKYGHVAFDTGQKAVLTTCVLRYKPAIVHPQRSHSQSISHSHSSGSSTSTPTPIQTSTPTPNPAPGGLTTRGGEGFIRCCFSFTIRRDAYGIPTMIVGNFIKL